MTFSLSLVVNLMTARRDGASVNGTKGDGQRSFVAAGKPSAFNQTLRPGPNLAPSTAARGLKWTCYWNCDQNADRPSKVPDFPTDSRPTTPPSALAAFQGCAAPSRPPLEGFPFTFPRALLIGCGLPCPGPRFEAILVPIEPLWSAENKLG